MSKKLVYLLSFVLVLSLVGSARGQLGKGNILYEYWNNIDGTAVSNLTDDPRYPDSPDEGKWWQTFEGDVDFRDNYGIRARGYLYPPASGDYTFWISGDDECQLWLSTDDDPANIEQIAYVTGWTESEEWDKFDEQKSQPITLQAGQKYYVEALMKDGTGGDSLAVAWGGPTIGTGPVIIEGKYLSPVIRPIDMIASKPVPADGAIYPDTWVSIIWQGGVTAVTHDVYLSENLADVQTRTADAFRGNQASTNLVIGFPGFPYPDGLVTGTTYYWRVDEVEADGTTVHEGSVWSFTVPPKKAYNPIPADGGAFIDPEANLSWNGGFGTKLHYVYFGDNFDDVNNAVAGLPQGNTTFDPGTLEPEKTYYWRVDEFDPPATHKGDVWSFTTTIPGLGTIIVERWDNIDGDNLDTLKSSLQYPNNPDVTEVLTQFSSDLDLDNYGGRIYGWLYAPATGDYTFWINSDNQGELWLSTDDDPENIELIATESGWLDLNIWGTGEQQSDPIPLQAGNRYYIEALWKEGGGGDHCQVAWQGPGIPTRTIIPGTNLSPYEPVQAYGPNPGSGASDIKQTTDLVWKPGIKAASHQVYFGTDEEAVQNADTSSSEYKGTRNLDDESYNPGKLNWNTTYYWRVDEVNNTNADSPWVGKVWSFTTADFLIVDDFESYNDLNPDEPGSNRIFLAWLDGFDNPAINGSVVGYENLPFTEQTIVHGGSQSMPFAYDNSVGKSEATLTLTYPRDWTENGVDTLAIWFRGNPVSFVEDPAGTFTMSAAGTDIWDQADEFRYAYKQLSGDGEITARVTDVGTGSNDWAKAGVMIRETLEPGSTHAIEIITPGSGSGVGFQWRPTTGSDSAWTDSTEPVVSAPYWVRIKRTGDLFEGFHSPDGITWEKEGEITISMVPNVYIGLCRTSHAAGEVRSATFDNVQTTGSVSLMWNQQAIGATMAANDPDAMYVALNGGQKVYHDNPNAALTTDWTEWNIDLQAFGVNLTNVNTITLGLDNSNNPAAGGSGLIYFDDIQLHQPAP